MKYYRSHLKRPDSMDLPLEDLAILDRSDVFSIHYTSALSAEHVEQSLSQRGDGMFYSHSTSPQWELSVRTEGGKLIEGSSLLILGNSRCFWLSEPRISCCSLLSQGGQRKALSPFYSNLKTAICEIGRILFSFYAHLSGEPIVLSVNLLKRMK